MRGHAKLIHKCHSSRRSNYCSSVKNEEIELHQLEYADLDYLVKTCYLTMIDLASKVQCGIENLWLKGR